MMEKDAESFELIPLSLGGECSSQMLGCNLRESEKETLVAGEVSLTSVEGKTPELEAKKGNLAAAKLIVAPDEEKCSNDDATKQEAGNGNLAAGKVIVAQDEEKGPEEDPTQQEPEKETLVAGEVRVTSVEEITPELESEKETFVAGEVSVTSVEENTLELEVDNGNVDALKVNETPVEEKAPDGEEAEKVNLAAVKLIVATDDLKGSDGDPTQQESAKKTFVAGEVSVTSVEKNTLELEVDNGNVDALKVNETPIEEKAPDGEEFEKETLVAEEVSVTSVEEKTVDLEAEKANLAAVKLIVALDELKGSDGDPTQQESEKETFVAGEVSVTSVEENTHELEVDNGNVDALKVNETPVEEKAPDGEESEKETLVAEEVGVTSVEQKTSELEVENGNVDTVKVNETRVEEKAPDGEMVCCNRQESEKETLVAGEVSLTSVEGKTPVLEAKKGNFAAVKVIVAPDEEKSLDGDPTHRMEEFRRFERVALTPPGIPHIGATAPSTLLEAPAPLPGALQYQCHSQLTDRTWSSTSSGSTGSFISISLSPTPSAPLTPDAPIQAGGVLGFFQRHTLIIFVMRVLLCLAVLGLEVYIIVLVKTGGNRVGPKVGSLIFSALIVMFGGLDMWLVYEARKQTITTKACSSCFPAIKCPHDEDNKFIFDIFTVFSMTCGLLNVIFAGGELLGVLHPGLAEIFNFNVIPVTLAVFNAVSVIADVRKWCAKTRGEEDLHTN